MHRDLELINIYSRLCTSKNTNQMKRGLSFPQLFMAIFKAMQPDVIWPPWNAIGTLKKVRIQQHDKSEYCQKANSSINNKIGKCEGMMRIRTAEKWK
jgi:hypothetical protein